MVMKDSGKRRTFGEGKAVRDDISDKPMLELIPAECLERVGMWYALGAKKYTKNNWRKGMPCSTVIGSMLRHIMKFEQGAKDEDHLAAIIWNAMTLMFYDIHYQDDESICDIQNWYDENGKPNRDWFNKVGE